MRALRGLSSEAEPGSLYRSFEKRMERQKTFQGLEFLVRILHMDDASESEGVFSDGGRIAFSALARSAIKHEEDAGLAVRHALTNREVEAAVEDNRIPLDKEGQVHDPEVTSGEREVVGATVADPREAELVLRTFWMFLRVLRLTCRVSH